MNFRVEKEPMILVDAVKARKKMIRAGCASKFCARRREDIFLSRIFLLAKFSTLARRRKYSLPGAHSSLLNVKVS
jgi:hypothetical protein